MPRHPPYTLKSLTTFIDHRHPRLPSLRSWFLTVRRACGTGAARTDAARPITDHFAKKVLDDTRPTERPSSGGGSTLAGAGIAEVSSFQMNLLLNLKIFTCQRTLISLLRKLLAAVHSISFPAERGRVGRCDANRNWLRFGYWSWRQPTRPSQIVRAADSFEFGRMSIGHADSFQASCPSVSVTGSASDLYLRGH
jgi:hypothetical protein